MTEYIYFLKVPGREDENFDFFEDAKREAMKHLSSKPIITQVEVHRDDFGMCTDSMDLGIIWSWEDLIKEGELENIDLANEVAIISTNSIEDFDKEFETFQDFPDETKPLADAADSAINALIADEEEAIQGYEEAEQDIRDSDIPEIEKDRASKLFDHIKEEEEEHIKELSAAKAGLKSAAGIPIEELVESLEENEDIIECKECFNLVEKACCTKGALGYICPECQGKKQKLHEDAELSYMSIEYTDLPVKGEKVNFVYKAPAVEVAKILASKIIDGLSADDSAAMADEQLASYVNDILNTEQPNLIKDNISDLRDRFRGEAIKAASENITESVVSYLSESYITVDNKKVDLYYDDLEVEITGPKRSEDEWDTFEGKISYTYSIDLSMVDIPLEDLLVDNLSEEEAEVTDKLSTQEYNLYIKTRIKAEREDLIDKYEDELLEYFREDAKTDAELNVSYDDVAQDGFTEALDQPKELIDCPECGNKTLDKKLFFCYSCGLN